MTDFRSDRMPSPEGMGQAQSRFRKAWDAYARTVERATPDAVKRSLEPAAMWVAGRVIEDSLGFWLLWQLEGGFEGLQEMGLSRSAIYRRVQNFRKLFGEHPDTFQMPGVTIDLDEYLKGRKMIGPHGERAQAARKAEVATRQDALVP